jgi:hypothetical protein
MRNLLSVGVLLLAGPVFAADADAARVGKLITQLGSNRYADREAAMQELNALGPAALAGLRQAAEAEDPEVRRRAEKLIRQIETRVAVARLLEPRKVRFVYRDTPVSEAVADLARRNGIPIQLFGDSAPLTRRRLTLDTGETGFWDAWDQFCRQAGVCDRGVDPAGVADDRYEYSIDDRRILAVSRTGWGSSFRATTPVFLADGKGPDLPTCYAGAIRIRAMAGKAGTAAEPETQLVLEAQPEPHLRWHGVLAVRVERAVDDEGRSLQRPIMASGFGQAAGKGAEEFLLIWNGIGEFPANPLGDARLVPVRFRLAAEPSRRLREISGTIAAQVRTAPETLVSVPRILDAAGQTKAGADGSSLQVIEAKRTESGQYRIRVSVTSALPELVSGGVPARLVVVGQVRGPREGGAVSPEGAEFALLDARGRRFPLDSVEVLGAVGQALRHDFTLYYNPPPDQAAPAQLMYTGRRTVIVTVPFTFRDVPLR